MKDTNAWLNQLLEEAAANDRKLEQESEEKTVEIDGEAEKQNISELAACIAKLRGEKDRCDAELSVIKGKIDETEFKMRSAMEAQGFEEGASVKMCGLRFTLRTKMRGACEPDKWLNVLKFAANGIVVDGKLVVYHNLIHRRMTDSVLVDMAENGIPWPEGVRMEPVKMLEIRSA